LELGDAGDVGDVSLHPKSMLNKAVFFELKIDMVANRHANRHANPCETFLEMYNALPLIFRSRRWAVNGRGGIDFNVDSAPWNDGYRWIVAVCCSVQGNGQIWK
jgi:hypothetical protein